MTENTVNWDLALPFLEIAWNNSAIQNTSYSPYYLNMGFHSSVWDDPYQTTELKDEIASTMYSRCKKLTKTLPKYFTGSNFKWKLELTSIGDIPFIAKVNT